MRLIPSSTIAHGQTPRGNFQVNVRSIFATVFSFSAILANLNAEVTYSLVKPDVVQSRLEQYKGNDNIREAALRKMFAEAGCQPSDLSEQAVPRRKQPNVVCVLPGTSQNTVVIGAHFDHVSKGAGLIDNWTGASLLPSLFQTLAGIPHAHTFVFVAFTGEESGEIGSTYYVSQLSKSDRARIQLMVTVDTLGLGPSEVWEKRSDKRAVAMLAATAKLMNLPLTSMNVDGVGESDEEPFIKKNICTVMIHTVTTENFHVLHSAADSMSALHFTDYYDSYRLLAAYLYVLDAKLGDEPTTCPAHGK